ncbi:MAG TPA: hypothetical protein VFN13_07005 [Rudaea sp.]|nr:hypothetical protein [Rudaea sp.]
MSGNEQLERELESFLGEEDSRVAALYRKLPQVQPGPEIDAAVLAMAHRAVRSSVRAPRARWIPGLGIAAAVLIAASVAIRLGPQVWNSHLQKTEHAVDQTSTLPDAKSNAGSASLPVLAPQPATAPAAPAKQLSRESGPPPPPAASAMPQPPPAPPIIPQSSARVVTPKVSARLLQNRANQAEHEDRAVPAMAPQAFPVESPAPARSETQTRSDANADMQAKPQRKLNKPAKTEHPAIVPPPPASAAPPAPRAQALPPPAAAHGQATAPPSPQLLRNSRLYPESWIAAIQKLIHDGHDKEARENLDYFRKKYPDYHLPADLEKFVDREK